VESKAGKPTKYKDSCYPGILINIKMGCYADSRPHKQ
jgi:hypothetical protein